MSTRATYTIDGQHFYIHHDGYKAGAASYFSNMIDAMNPHNPKGIDYIDAYAGRGGAPFAFIRGNGMAEPISSPHDHDDTEFDYVITTTSDGSMHLEAKQRPWDGGAWKVIFSGSLTDFINENPEIHKRHYVYASSPYSKSRPMSVEQCEEAATWCLRKAETFEKSNPNHQDYIDRANAYNEAA